MCRWECLLYSLTICIVMFAAIGLCDAGKLPDLDNGYAVTLPGYSDSVYRSVQDSDISTLLTMDICRLECKKGYRLLGVATVFCTLTGWSGVQNTVCASMGGAVWCGL